MPADREDQRVEILSGLAVCIGAIATTVAVLLFCGAGEAQGPGRLVAGLFWSIVAFGNAMGFFKGDFKWRGRRRPVILREEQPLEFYQNAVVGLLLTMTVATLPLLILYLYRA